MDHHTDDGRLAAAEQLAGYDPRAGADALRAIARDHGVDDDIRLEAASRLPEIDQRAAADAFLGIPDERPRLRRPLGGTLTWTPPPPSPPRPPRPPR